MALPVVLRAVAEAGLGEMDEAAWDWYAAQAIYPEAARAPDSSQDEKADPQQP